MLGIGKRKKYPLLRISQSNWGKKYTHITLLQANLYFSGKSHAERFYFHRFQIQTHKKMS